jgi:hypothetical protein
MFNDPVFLQYLSLGLCVFAVTVLCLFLYHRIVNRRKRAGDLAVAMRDFGLNRLADPLDCYSHGDYSGAVEGFAQLAKEMRTPAGAIALMEVAVVKIVTHYAADHATKAQELMDILQNGTAIKAAAEKAKAAVKAAA